MEGKLTEKLSLWQLSLIIVIFEMGSATVIGLGTEAEQDAWIAVFIGGIFAVGYIFFLHYFLSKLPGKNLFEIFEFCIGKFAGRIVILMYIVYFFYLAARILRDFDELLVSSIYIHTPVEIISLTMMMVIAYMLYLGVEVLARTSEIFFPYVFFFTVMVGISIALSGEIEPQNILPILADGPGPLGKALFPGILTFPYGELIAFALLLPAVSKFKLAGKAGMLAALFSGLLLTYTTFIQIATMGPRLRTRSVFPLLSAAREISLLNFIERVDLLIIFVVMFGIIVKVTVFFYGGLKGMEQIFKLPYRVFAFPAAMVISLFSVLISANFAEHIEEGLIVVPKYLHLPFQFFIPVLLLPLLIFKTRKKRGREAKK